MRDPVSWGQGVPNCLTVGGGTRKVSLLVHAAEALVTESFSMSLQNLLWWVPVVKQILRPDGPLMGGSWGENIIPRGSSVGVIVQEDRQQPTSGYDVNPGEDPDGKARLQRVQV